MNAQCSKRRPAVNSHGSLVRSLVCGEAVLATCRHEHADTAEERRRRCGSGESDVDEAALACEPAQIAADGPFTERPRRAWGTAGLREQTSVNSVQLHHVPRRENLPVGAQASRLDPPVIRPYVRILHRGGPRTTGAPARGSASPPARPAKANLARR